MHKILFTFLLFSFTILTTQAQDLSVEKSTYGIQTGLLGLWGYNESRLSNELALRTEIGLDASIFGGGFVEKTGVILAPVLSLEPRWYYNLNKRAGKSRKTFRNTGNFVSLKTSYHPDLFTISNYDHVTVIPNLSIIPTWGIRRHIGRHFNFETGIGFGYNHTFGKSKGYRDIDELAVNLHLRLGYSF